MLAALPANVGPAFWLTAEGVERELGIPELAADAALLELWSARMVESDGRYPPA